MHHPAIDQRYTGEEEHPNRHGAPAERGSPRVRQLSPSDEDHQGAERAEHETGGDRDVDRTPPGRVCEHRGAFPNSARWHWGNEKAAGLAAPRARHAASATPRPVT